MKVQQTMWCLAFLLLSGRPSAHGQQPIRIMPLGDSITRGSMGHPRYDPGGYRTRLFIRLREQFDVDFVGSQTTNPDPENLPDDDHEGHKGFRIDQIDANINDWLDAARPKVVLLMIGANDVNQNYELDNAPKRLKSLIDKILDHPSQPHVIVAQICGSTDANKDAAIVRFNRSVAEVVANGARDKKNRISLADMYSALETPDDFGNFLHPNSKGYDKIADVWFAAVMDLKRTHRKLFSGDDGRTNVRVDCR